MPIAITEHAFQRMRERFGLKRRSAQRTANKAWEKNETPQADPTGRILPVSRGRRRVIAHGDMVLIFDHKTLMTVYRGDGHGFEPECSEAERFRLRRARMATGGRKKYLTRGRRP